MSLVVSMVRLFRSPSAVGTGKGGGLLLALEVTTCLRGSYNTGEGGWEQQHMQMPRIYILQKVILCKKISAVHK
jgi:hypothetical protein